MAGKAKGAESSTYRVVAQLVQVQVGSRVLQFSYGDVLPEVSKEAFEHLQSLGFVESGDSPVGEPIPVSDDNN